MDSIRLFLPCPLLMPFVKYYDIFKKIKHDLNISGIFSYGQNEDAEGKDEHSRDSLERIIKDYNEMYGPISPQIRSRLITRTSLTE